MSDKRFNPAKLEKLNNPDRIKEMPVDFMAQEAKLDNPNIIIDLGAGTALFSKALSELFPSAKIYACDISPVMVDWMLENVKPHYSSIIPMVMKDASINLDDNCADFLLMVNLHHEIDNPLETLKEAYRLIKPGGAIAVSDWRKEEMPKGPPVAIRVDSSEVKKQLETAGFTDIKIFTEFRHNYLLVAKKQ